MDWGTVISSGYGGKPAQDKRAFPRTPVTPSTSLVSVVRPSLRDKSVPGVKRQGVGGGLRVVGCFCFSSHLSPLPLVALFLCLVGLDN